MGQRLHHAAHATHSGSTHRHFWFIFLSTRPIQTRDFSWDINLNFSKNSNKVKELDGESDMFELEKASWLDVQVAAKVGENFGSIVGPDFQRSAKGDILIDPQTGLRCV